MSYTVFHLSHGVDFLSGSMLLSQGIYLDGIQLVNVLVSVEAQCPGHWSPDDPQAREAAPLGRRWRAESGHNLSTRQSRQLSGGGNYVYPQ